MNWDSILVSGAVGFAVWLLRRGLIKYERALVSAETLRRQLVEKELEKLQNMIVGVHTAAGRQTKDREALTHFMIGWAKDFQGQMAEKLKIPEADLEELRIVLNSLVTFFQVPKDPNETRVKEIGKNVFLVHRAEGGKHEPEKS